MHPQIEYLKLEKLLLLLLTDLAGIVAAARFFAWVFRRFGQPAVVGEILAGVILGPSLLGRFWPGVYATMLPKNVSGMLSVISQIGLVLLMLLIGLEFPFAAMSRAIRPAAATAISGIVVPFAGAYALAGWIYRIAPGSGGENAFRLFFATAVSITAIPIMGRILIETRLTRTRMGLVSISAAAIDDALGWILLGAVVALVTRGDVRASALALSFSAVAAAATFFWAAGRFGLARLRIRLREGDRLSLPVLSVVLAVTFLTAALTNALGVFSIFGGFLCGVAVSFNETLARGIRNSIGDLVYALLLPIFFMFSGLRTDLRSLGGGGVLLWALAAVIVVSCVTKFGATMLASRVAGLPWREAFGVGLLMNTRALMALVVINIGADLGVVSSPVFFMLITMALTTTVITTPILRRAYPMPQETEGAAELRSF
jgi:Kef-type K+ transport system membrane component KefB